MTPAQEARESRSVLERHVQTIIGAVVVGLLGWVGITLQDMTASVARLEEKVAGLERQLMHLQSQTADRYTRQDAVRDLTVMRKILDDHAERLKDLEKRAWK